MTKYFKKAETDQKSRNDRKKTEKPSKSRIFLLKAEEVAALPISQANHSGYKCSTNSIYFWIFTEDKVGIFSKTEIMEFFELWEH